MSDPTSAHGLLSTALRAHIDTVRKTTARVLATAPARRKAGGAGAAAALGAAAQGAQAGGTEADDDAEEAVHDFRVGLRRLRTALRPARLIYGDKRMRAVSGGLKRYADATSALRDEEVLRKTLGDLELSAEARAALTAWIARRARQERGRRSDVVKLLRGEAPAVEGGDGGDDDAPTVEECLERLEKRLHKPKDDKTSAAELGQRALAKARDGIAELGDVNTDDGSAMHELRIRYKRLRYTAELFALVLGEELERTAKAAAKVQSRLGDLHDLDEALLRITRARGLAVDVRVSVLEALREARARMAARCTKELLLAKQPSGEAQRTIESDLATKS
jgi:CHAD domain-containing protein